MKIKTRIRFILVCLILALLLPTAVSAALPPSVEPQWENTNAVICSIVTTEGSNAATARATIFGKTGTTVSATATLYKIKNGVTTVLYTGSTPANNPLPMASFTHEFTLESGATYHWVLSATVSKNGLDETINDSDTITVP